MKLINKIVNFITTYQADGICFASPVNRFWCTNFDSSLGFLFVNKVGKSILLVDSRYITAAKNFVDQSIEVILIDKKLSILIAESLKKLKIKKLIVEEEYLNLKDYFTIEQIIGRDNLVLVNTSLIRQEKNHKELEELQHAANIAALTINKLRTLNLIGKTEIEVARMIDIMMLEMGATKNSFDSIVASGVNSANPHHHPTNKVIEDGDMLIVDIGCVYNNYCSDITRSFIVGDSKKTNPELIKIWEIVHEAQVKAIAALENNVCCKEIDKVARSVINNYGYGNYFQHALGHGVGLDVHERPILSPTSIDTISDYSVFTIEPGIYVPNLGGVRLEDTLVFEKGKPKILTIKAPKQI